MKRLQLDLELDSLSEDELSFLSSLTKKATTKHNAKVHDCGHEAGKKCTNVVEL